MKLKKISLICIIILLILMNNTSFGVVFDYNDSQIELPDIYFYHYVVLKRYEEFFLMVLDKVYDENNFICRARDSSFAYCKGVKTRDDNLLVHFPYYQLIDGEWFYKGDSKWTIGQCSIVYSTEDIYYNNEVFFQKAPLMMESYQIPQMEKITQLPEIIVGVAKVIIPGSLIILSMVLVILLAKSVISRMG